MMFFTVLNFEFRYWLKNISVYFYMLILFLFAIISMAGNAGIFGEGSTGTSIANSPLNIYSLYAFFFKILLFITPSITGYSVYRDHKYKVHSFLFTYPVSKIDYISGKFISSFLIIVLLALSVMTGLIAGTFLPGLDNNLMVPFDLFVYIKLFFIYLLPNLLLTALIVFASVLFTNNLYSGFISVILIFAFREIISRLTGGLDSYLTYTLTDPFGETAINHFINNLTPAEFNFTPVPFEPLIILNRIIWLSVALLISILILSRFSFKQRMNNLSLKLRRVSNESGFDTSIKKAKNFYDVTYNYSFIQRFKIVIFLAYKDLRFIITSGSFISILCIGILLIAVILLQMNPQTETKLLPVTYRILGLPVFFYSFLILGMTFLYSGILTHRAEASGIYDLICITPVPDCVFYISRLTALIMMQMILLVMIMLTGIGIQIYSGYYNFEIGLYLFDLFVIQLSGLIIWAIASLFIQSVFRNTFTGLFVLILLFFISGNLSLIGIETPLLAFNKDPGGDFLLQYSDMNGYGSFLLPYFIYKFYWGIFAIILSILTVFIIQRKITFSKEERFKVVISRFKGLPLYIAAGFALVFLTVGIIILREENKPLNKKYTVNEQNVLLENFRENFSKYIKAQQPRIKSVFIKMNIFPEENNFTAEGSYTLVNKTENVIDTILLRTGFDEITAIEFPGEVISIAEDSSFNFTVYRLKNGIMPKDSIRLEFNIKNKPNTILTKNSNVLGNGTFIKQDIFPRLGYFAETEKSMPDDSSALNNHYQGLDSDLIDLEIIASTTESQKIIAPGTLLKEWTKDGRRYFHYKPERKIKFVFGFNSGEYEFLSESYKGVELRIYFHKEHDHNLIQMMDGLKASLDYNTSNFGDYQHSQAYIVEFPNSEGTYATTSANLIPVSEIRFINDPEKSGEENIDISFYVAAHELSHQWWGNQVMPANVNGAHMITESIAEYITAKIYEKKFGKKNALRFLKIQLQRYLNGRTEETGSEQPLIYVTPEQSYISYGKGAIALYVLSEYIGEENLNKALREFLNKVKFKGPPYSTSTELITYIYDATPDSLHYIIKDLFESADAEKTNEYFKSIIDNTDVNLRY